MNSDFQAFPPLPVTPSTGAAVPPTVRSFLLLIPPESPFQMMICLHDIHQRKRKHGPLGTEFPGFVLGTLDGSPQSRSNQQLFYCVL